MIFLCIALFCLASAAEPSQPSGFSESEKQLIGTDDSQPMRVLQVTDPADSLILRTRCIALDTISAITPDAFVLYGRMLATVTDPDNEGVGIASPQVGISRRVVAVQRFDQPDFPFGIYVNPALININPPTVSSTEGCLSIPEVVATVPRSDRITLAYYDPYLRQCVTETVEGFTAIIFQHEIDHLDGIIFTDRIERQNQP